METHPPGMAEAQPQDLQPGFLGHRTALCSMLLSCETYFHPPTLPPMSGHGLLSPQANRAQLDRPSIREAPRCDGVMALSALEKDSPFKEKGKALCAGICACFVMGHITLNPKEEGKRGGGELLPFWWEQHLS